MLTKLEYASIGWKCISIVRFALHVEHKAGMSERRENQRIPVALDVVLNYREHALICTLRDISLNGAFVEAEPDDLPYTNSPVELGFTLTKDGNAQYCRITARISRVTGNGAAVSFSDVGMDAYSSLVSIVYQA